MYNGQGFIYPNPFNDQLHIKTRETLNIKLINSIGKVVVEKRITKEESIDVSKLSKGVYYLLINSGSGTKPIKLIKD